MSKNGERKLYRIYEFIEVEEMKIKGFDKDLKCRGFQFEIGKEYKIDVKKEDMRLCTNTVFHYCDSLHNVHKFYDVLGNNRFCEIEVLGEEITDGEKYGSNHIKIVREIKGRELNMSSGVDGENKIYTQINELVNLEEIPKYLDIFVCTNYGEEENALSTFRVNID